MGRVKLLGEKTELSTIERGSTHVIGRLITLIYALLKQDDETLSHLAPGTQPPEPVLYDPELHRHHRTGHYQPLRKKLPENQIVHVSS